MPIGTIETFVQVLRKLVYGSADGMPSSFESMVVCDKYTHIAAQIAYDLNNPNPVPENVIQFVQTFDEWIAALIIRMEEISRDLIDSSVTNMDALCSEVSGATADKNRRAVAYTTLEHLNDMRHHADIISFPRLNLGIRFPGSGNKA
ncbi:hypothetical protein V502_00877 [Pseudogymnoascus sp. VKM F-4520 (FW-2644)]|nr:hypothetical protein V502_00877 [Pseudogymnoascus sp. VKM F-4520 (FW-2644)]